MTPATHQLESVKLYKAKDFPEQWECVATLLEGKKFADPTIFNCNDVWWILVETGEGLSGALRLYYSKNLNDNWQEHPQSPVVTDDSKSRPGGRILQMDNGKIYRITQDCNETYGKRVRAFEILTLNTSEYSESEIAVSPILEPDGSGWNSDRMHQFDVHQVSEQFWIAGVDGFSVKNKLIFNTKW